MDAFFTIYIVVGVYVICGQFNTKGNIQLFRSKITDKHTRQKKNEEEKENS